MRTFSLDVLRGPNSWYMVVSPFCPKSSQYTFGCLSPSDWEKGKNWKRLPFSGVSHKTTFSSALSALNNGFLGWGFQYQTFSILSPSNRCALGEWTSKYFEAISFDRGLLTHYVCPNVFINPWYYQKSYRAIVQNLVGKLLRCQARPAPSSPFLLILDT